MTHKELITEIHKDLRLKSLSRKDVEFFVKIFVEKLTDGLVKFESVNVTDIGTFSVLKQPQIKIENENILGLNQKRVKLKACATLKNAITRGKM